MKNALDHFFTDRGGRRRISDRRYRVAARKGPERRTGWRRRSGLDRRFRDFKGPVYPERRTGNPEH